MTIRAVLYARVCVDDGQNLAEQLESCRSYAQKRGWNIIDGLAEQGAGSDSSRLPQLDRMLEMARAGAFDVLVVREPNRLSRDLLRLLAITGELERVCVRILYTLDGFRSGILSVVDKSGTANAEDRVDGTLPGRRANERKHIQ